MREERLKEMLEKASKKKPVTRQTICDTFHIGDRKARRMIEALRERGIRVCGLNTTEGYWIAKSQDEYEQFRRDYAAKAATIFRRVKNMDNQTDEGQVSILELL